jgi:RimJ/RimL family protein N-acetyltransferase
MSTWMIPTRTRADGIIWIMEAPLFTGRLVALTVQDGERDAEVMARWTEDAEYQHLAVIEPPRPLSPSAIKKQVQAKAAKDDMRRFDFAIRRLEDDRLVGLAGLYWVDWTHGAAWLDLAIPSSNDRGHGYGKEALQLLMRYAFTELNLYRLTCRVFEYNLTALHFLESAGFKIEVRRREAILRHGRRWSAFLLGLLKEEWLEEQAQQAEQG